MQTKERYLATGCAGFIGSRVASMLLDAGHEVVGVDQMNDAYDVRLKEHRLAQLMGREGFTFEKLDVGDREAVQRRFAEDAKNAGGPNSNDGPPYAAVVNLAARAGVRPSVENPWVYLETNAAGTLNLLEACRVHHVPKFVLSSTSSLYGACNPIPYREDADVTRPLSPYAASKSAAETMCHVYHHLHQLDVTVLRYFTVYGPAGRPDMSVLRFVRRIAEGEPILVFGDGEQQRDFTYVDDIAKGTIAAIRPLGYETINLGGDRPVKLSTVIEQISKLVDRPVKIERRAAHPADVPATWANVERAGRLLDWSPRIALEEGLRRTVEWYRANREFVLQLDLGDR
jgi:nucleoside-diphosphate-sugar epimerase